MRGRVIGSVAVVGTVGWLALRHHHSIGDHVNVNVDGAPAAASEPSAADDEYIVDAAAASLVQPLAIDPWNPPPSIEQPHLELPAPLQYEELLQDAHRAAVAEIAAKLRDCYRATMHPREPLDVWIAATVAGENVTVQPVLDASWNRVDPALDACMRDVEHDISLPPADDDAPHLAMQLVELRP